MSALDFKYADPLKPVTCSNLICFLVSTESSNSATMASSGSRYLTAFVSTALKRLSLAKAAILLAVLNEYLGSVTL